ncbi:PAS domain-containing protein [Pedobacter sp. HMF7647]|uniref:histidine kinase n=1 Tax=Hufsiella arboris TaxID=2695275 RepID=A0A7K1YG75_9SPHI|nr:PAS domain-containing sensor histidine kinase [Hufsiella arboris]MXV52999.1 PAS domain-containing protein [Hufsiella arboris]
MEDNTSHNQTAEHSPASDLQFNLLTDSMPQQVWTASPDGKLTYINSQARAFFGKTSQELLGIAWLDVIHPDDKQQCVETWTYALETGTLYEVEFRLANNQGVYKWHLGRALPVKEKGEIVKWIGTNTDIDERKRNEQSKDEFISIASHELKTPLTTAKAYIQLYERMQTGIADKPASFIQKAGQSILKLEKLVNDLLDVSKINAGKLMYNVEAFWFDEMLDDVIESVQNTAPQHRIIIEQTAHIEYKGDKLRIEQVVNNLLNNAIKYSPGKDRVIVRCEVHQENIVVSVQDLGIGIAPEHLGNLFNRFYRLDNTVTRFEGLGLGLYIASEIVKRHNGSFWIESEPGVGSTFYFLLPVNGKIELKEYENTKTSYKANFIEIVYNQSEHRIEANWLGYQNYDSVKKGCLHMLDILRDNHCDRVLNDNTYVIGNWSEAVDWGGEVWFPAMENAGLKYFAWIYSPSTFSRMSAEKSIDIAVGNLITRFFTEKEEADNWLKSLDQ